MRRQNGNVENDRPHTSSPDPSDDSDALTFERSLLPDSYSSAHAHPQPMRLLPRDCRLRVATTLGVVLLALAILVGTSPALRAGFGGPLTSAPTATPTSPILPGADLFYFSADVPWAQATLDGKPLHSGYIGQSGPPRLHRGRHFLVWLADPFQPRKCSFSLPPQYDDTCQFDHTPSATAVGSISVSPQVVHLAESLATLPPDPANALLAAMRQSMTSFTATVAPGEHFFGPSGVAVQPLRATLSYQLDVGTNGTNVSCWLDGLPSTKCTLDGRDCAAICAVPWQSRHVTAAPTWLAFAPALPTWSFDTPDGRSLAHNVALDAGAAGAVDILTLFSISWDAAGWHVHPLFGADAPSIQDDTGQPVIGAACAPAQDDLQGYFFFLSQVRYVEDTNPANGCLAVATINPTVAPPPQVGPLPHGDTTATFLVRFGLLVALDDAAHRIEPLASRATPDERALAARLAAQPGQICITFTSGC